MKKFISLFLSIAMLLSITAGIDFSAYADTYSGTCGDNLIWSLDTDTGVLTISGSGDMKNYSSSSSAPWYNYSDSITDVELLSGITSIGEDAFSHCKSLASVIIPNSVINIGKFAFWYCTSLTSVTIPDSVTSIGSYAFHECSSLTSITIPDSVTNIGNCAFTSLTSIDVDENNEYYSSQDGVLFNKNKTKLVCYPAEKAETSYKIPDSVTSIGDSAFYECSSLTSVTIPDSVISIGSCAFYYCTSLKSVTIPNSVTSIGYYAFRDCTSLKSVTIPNSVTSIGSNAFTDCTSLTKTNYTGTIDDWVSIYFADGAANPISHSEKLYINNILQTNITIDEASEISAYAFEYCSSIRSVTIGDSVTSIGEHAFVWCDNLTSITIPDSVTSIDNWTFGYCSSLTSITIPDSVTSIGSYAFGYCTSLTSITIPDSVTSIGDYAFERCTSLTSVTIPNSVINIGKYTFWYCTSLTNVTIPDSVTSISTYAFGYCTSLTDVYYAGSEDDWNNISIGSSNTYLTNATIHYNSSDTDTNSDFEYEVLDDGTAEITGYSGTETDITIPSTIDGYTVTSIGDYAFEFNDDLTSITIPDGVTSIGEWSFAGCYNLVNLDIPDSVTNINNCAFLLCIGLTSITIPDSVMSIGYGAFAGCISSTSIDVSDKNEYYSSQDGVLFNKDKTELIQYPAGNESTSYQIPDSVSSISGYAFVYCYYLKSVAISDSVASIDDDTFYACENLTSVTIPDSVTSIGYGAFAYCTSLISVTIPNSVTRIYDCAFYDCENITDVYFTGSEDDWNSISIGDDNEYLTNATIHYNSSGDTTAYDSFIQSFDVSTYAADDLINNSESYALDYYENDFQDPSEIMVNALKADSSFVNTVAAWEASNAILDVNIDAAVDFNLDIVSYYEAILFSMCENTIESSTFLDVYDYSLAVNLIKFGNKIDKFINNYKDANITYDKTLTDDQKELLLKDLSYDKDSADCIDLATKVLDYTDDLNSFYKTMSVYYSMESTAGELLPVLEEVRNCSTDENLNIALDRVIRSIESQYGALLTSIESGAYQVYQWETDVVIDMLLDELVKLNPVVKTLKTAGAIGKTISNFAFSTDATIEQFYAMKCLGNFQSYLKTAVTAMRSDYQTDKTSENAQNYIISLNMLFNSYDLGCEYASEYGEIVYEKALVGKAFMSNSETYAGYKENVQEIQTALTNQLNAINKYWAFNLMEDCPELFDVVAESIQLYKLDALDDTMIRLSGLNFDYTGEEICPKVYVCANGEYLTEGEDFTVEYSNNISIGTASVTITSTNQYYPGTVTRYFSINDDNFVTEYNIRDNGRPESSYLKSSSFMSMTNSLLLASANDDFVVQVYDGDTLVAEVADGEIIENQIPVIINNGNITILMNDRDYTVKYSSLNGRNIDVGISSYASDKTVESTVTYTDLTIASSSESENVVAKSTDGLQSTFTNDGETVNSSYDSTDTDNLISYSITAQNCTSSKTQAYPGEIIYVNYSATATYDFVGWTTSFDNNYTSESFSFVMPAEDVSITAECECNHLNCELETVAATCTEDGTKTYTCTECGYTYTEIISATGHSYDSGVVTKAATCSATGV
ncbi:MAG: leucine-rich repeat protein, partial [Clostridiales bacterium]|nr:leucine-rich repeat protein [Clostridiales bacterium]